MPKKPKQTNSTTDAACAAKVGTSGIGMSTVAMLRFANIVGEQTPEELVAHLRQQVDAVAKGDLSGVESMLVGQAIALQSIFANLVNRAALNMGESLGAVDVYMKLALRAQSQCRATLETLANIKNPPVVYARQANVTTGPQQINNGVDPRSREIESEQSQFLEQQYVERLDTGTQGAAGRADLSLEALGARDRPKDARG